MEILLAVLSIALVLTALVLAGICKAKCEGSYFHSVACVLLPVLPLVVTPLYVKPISVYVGAGSVLSLTLIIAFSKKKTAREDGGITS